MSLQDVVNVQISRQTQAVARTSFGVAMILGEHKSFTELIRFYSSLSAVGNDFSSSQLEYKAATALFSQSPTVSRIAIGRRAADNCVVSAGTVVDNTNYTVTINGTAFTINSGVAATNLTIMAALEIAINAGTEPVTANDNLDGTMDLDADVVGVDYTVSTTSNLSYVITASGTVADDLDAIQEQDDTWYGIVETTHVPTTAIAVAAWTESQKKIFGAGSQEANIINTTAIADTTTIAAVVKAAAYARTFVFYSGNADTQYPEARLFGELLPKDPGTYTAKFKTLGGLTVDNLTDTQITNAKAKNCMIYTEVGGVNITEEGVDGEGEFIDIIIGVDWLQARITERVFSRLVNLDKVPFTDGGLQVIGGEISAQLDIASSVPINFLAAPDEDTPAYTVTIPKASSFSAVQKAAREVTGITFVGYLAGAIHSGGRIFGVVTY